MAEKPILFSGDMVRAILEGRKTQTRRIISNMTCRPLASGDWYFDSYCDKPKTTANPRGMGTYWSWWERQSMKMSMVQISCPYGVPGDLLWVKETWREAGSIQREDGKIPKDGDASSCYYRATDYAADGPWRPSIFMPRWASRISLQIKNIRSERLQNITNEDAMSEGATPIHYLKNPFHTGAINAEFSGEVQGWRDAYRDIWEKISGAGSWNVNPQVWVVEFEVISRGGAETRSGDLKQ